MPDQNANPEPKTLAEHMDRILAEPPETQWGDWKLVDDGAFLVLFSNGWDQYTIPLDRATTDEQQFFWLMQLAEKTWATPEILGNLVRAFKGLRTENFLSLLRHKS